MTWEGDSQAKLQAILYVKKDVYLPEARETHLYDPVATFSPSTIRNRDASVPLIFPAGM